MKKLVIITALIAGSFFTSCALFVRTPVGSAGGAVGSTQRIHPAHADGAKADIKNQPVQSFGS